MKQLLRMIDPNDVFVLIGLGAVFYGLQLLSTAAAWIVLGAVMLGLGMLGAWRKAR